MFSKLKIFLEEHHFGSLDDTEQYDDSIERAFLK
jgi:hypothetical protein